MDDASTFIENMDYDRFKQDRKTVYAVIRVIEIIGGSFKKIFHQQSKIDTPRFRGKILRECVTK